MLHQKDTTPNQLPEEEKDDEYDKEIEDVEFEYPKAFDKGTQDALIIGGYQTSGAQYKQVF